jgi:tetratricopeptide (TPR) repeat protein
MLLANTALAHMVPPRPVVIHIPPRMLAPEARLPIRLQKVDVRAEVMGSAAHTRIEMVFFNPNERALEGELQFPLQDGQSVTGFALDINGELRPAVPVDKAKGQQVFEDVIRTRIDPALLEKTQGNNYKLRVYPLPAHGTRRVVLEFDEVLSRDSENATKGINYTSYRLPLQFAEAIEQLDVAVHNPATPAKHSAMAVRAQLGVERIRASYAYDQEPYCGSLVSFSRKNYSGNELLTIDYPNIGEPLFAAEARSGKTYFYAEISTPFSKPALRIAPKTVGVIWDASGSGAARDHGREYALLDAYFKTLDSVKVVLTVARDRAEAPQHFSIKSGDWRSLRNVLEKVAYDGATSGEALSPAKTTDLTILFSDGLINFGTGAFVAGDKPLYAVNASVSADQSRMRVLAENSGGRLLNILNIAPDEAVNELTQQFPRLTGMHSNGAKELVSESVFPESGRIKIAGILTEPQTTIDLDWLDAQGQHQSQQVKIQNTAKPLISLAANRWAALTLAQLESDYALNRAAIRRLGNSFGMVTRETSLVVLDRVDDYVRYEIMPPESLRGEYEAKLAQKERLKIEERGNHLNKIAKSFAQKVAWWEKKFPKGEMPESARSFAKSGYREMAMASSARAMEMSRSEAQRMVSQHSVVPAPMMAPPRTMNSAPAPSESVISRIELKKWAPDASYVKRLRDATPEQMYRIYLDERPTYTNSTAFFLDAADIFIERGQPELGIRILSNLAEMNLENRQILRILAYRLLQAKQPKLALPILRQVLILSPNEPQSWRDLGLAYAEDAQYQMAIDNLWEVVSQNWNERFPDVELIALAELNAIVARVPQGTVNTSLMDTRLLRNLPLDVRAVLSWDADNTDIDLWVTDPNNEKVFYANRLGFQGGSMSRDFTGGYGPEEFSLRNAKPGTYKVQAEFYGNHQQVVSGATTLMLRLSTGFGTAQQKDENIILRLSGQGSEVEVGTFEIAKMP